MSTTRWNPSHADLATLNTAFDIEPFPNTILRQSLANNLGISMRQVQVWFQNKRQKTKKASVDGAETMPASPVAHESKPVSNRPASPIRQVPSSPQAIPPEERSTPPPLVPPPSFGLPAPPAPSSLRELDELNSAIRQALMQRLLTLPLPHGFDQVFGHDRIQPLAAQQLFPSRPTLPPTRSAIGKPPRPSAVAPGRLAGPPMRLAGLPMRRRGISMEALEVLSSRFEPPPPAACEHTARR